MKMKFLYFVSFPYTITDHQSPENLKYIPRGAKWCDVKKRFFQVNKMWKKKSALTYKRSA